MAYVTDKHTVATEKLTPNVEFNVDLDALFEEIDRLPTTRISPAEYLKLNIKLVNLLKNAKDI